MKELSELFGGDKHIANIETNESYKKWFATMTQQIESLNFQNTTQVGRKINQLIKALDDIENYHHISSNYVVRHYLSESRKDLKHMVKISNVQNEILT
jgi:WASH complex subunit strumpellin